MKKFVTLSETSAKAPQITGGGNSREMEITETSIVRRGMDGVSSAFRRAVVGLLSRRASDEHPMSTRSASDGTLRKRGLIQHIAAVFMLLFFVGVYGTNGSAVAATTYYAIIRSYSNNTSESYMGGVSNSSTYANTGYEYKGTEKASSFASYSELSGWTPLSNFPEMKFDRYTKETTLNKTFSSANAINAVTEDAPLYYYAKARENFEFKDWIITCESSHMSVTYEKLPYEGGVHRLKITGISNPDPAVTVSQTSDIANTIWVQAVFQEEGAGIETATITCEAPEEGGSYSFTYKGNTTNVTTNAVDVEGVEVLGEVTLSATPDENYKLDRFYAVVGGERQTLNVTANGDATLPEGATAVGAEFIRTYDVTCQVTNEGGSYSVKYKGATTNITTEATLDDVTTKDNVTLTATPASAAYQFSRFYAIVDGVKTTLGARLIAEQEVIIPERASAIGAEFSNATYYVNGVFMEDLASAIQAAQSEIAKGAESATIVVLQNATVPAGNYTIPAGVTLLIPYKDGQIQSNGLDHTNTEDIPLGAYRTLTLADGAHLEVYGTIEVSGAQTTGGRTAAGDKGVGRTAGPYYGLMNMRGSSSITLNKGAEMRVWGFVIGERGADGRYTSEIDVRRGATVYEMFTMMDWKEVAAIVRITQGENTYHVLPISQYHIQNIEVATLYRPGSRLYGAGSVDIGGTTLAMNNAGVLGIRYNDGVHEDDKAIFLLDNADESEDTWIRKFYDPATDQQVYEANNSAYLGSLQMYVTIPGIAGTVPGQTDNTINVDSRAYQLPITNNFKLHLLSGEMKVTQNTELLPGAVFEVDKQATLIINGTGYNSSVPILLLYDADNWDKYISTAYNNGTYSYGYATRYKYRPEGMPDNTVRDISSAAGLGDAKLIVHGTVDVQGMLKTTDDGASITSTIEDAGTITISREAGTGSSTTSDKTYQIPALTNPITYQEIHRVPALLQNGEGNTAYGATTSTESTMGGQSFCFIDVNKDGKGEWVKLEDDGCFVKETAGNKVTYYAKPQEYVALANGKTENPDHTYSDAAGKGRLFIHMDDCQWWEVENVDNLYHCLHPDNNTYYYWNEEHDRDNQNHPIGGWDEKKFAISWVNWNGSKIKDANDPTGNTYIDPYMLTYGTMPKYNNTNPTREDDVDYTYNFIGWSPAIAPVTGDATYTAVYEKVQKKYTIIYTDANGNEITREQLALGAMPTPPAIEATSYWTPAVGTVIGNQTYTLTLGTPEHYTVTFVNWDGTTVSTETYDELGVDIDIPNDNPTRDETKEYTYTFTGWSPEISTGAKVTGNATYTAQYSASPKTYAIKFYDENGTQIGETQNLPLGADPVVPNYTKAADAEYTYATEWKIKDSETVLGVHVPSVSGAANYQATFRETLNRYTVKLQSNNEAVCTFTGGGVYDYGTTKNIAVTATIGSGYEFDHWDGVDWTTASGTITELTGNITLTLYVKPEGEDVQNLEVGINDEQPVTIVNPTQYNDFVLTSNGSASGQVINAQNITLFGDAYFNYEVNAESHKWYAVGVPWQVDATSGISVNGRTLVLGKDFDITYYDGALRAQIGPKKCWKYVENDADKTLQPGRLYMIGLMMDAPVIRFKKKAQAALLTTTTSVTAYPSDVITDRNWNGIANPALFHTYVNPGVTKGVVYDSSIADYKVIDDLSADKFVVGQAVFVQAPDDKIIGVAHNNSFNAPRRLNGEEKIRYDVALTPENADYSRHVFVHVDNEKEEDQYIIGQDLAHMGSNPKVAQIWVERYNTKLCVNTVAMEDESASYPLGISVPATGEYTISTPSANSDTKLYLTLDGDAIWNLSSSPYTTTLEAGTTHRYGLRATSKVVEIFNGIDEALVDAKGETRKVLVGEKVYIIRENKVYTVEGQLVK